MIKNQKGDPVTSTGQLARSSIVEIPCTSLDWPENMPASSALLILNLLESDVLVDHTNENFYFTNACTYIFCMSNCNKNHTASTLWCFYLFGVLLHTQKYFTWMTVRAFIVEETKQAPTAGC